MTRQDEAVAILHASRRHRASGMTTPSYDVPEYGAWVARAMMDAHGRAALAARYCGEHEDGTRAFADEFPALVRWRTLVLRDPRRHAPAIVAAACELVALECALQGQDELAERAFAEAERAVLGAPRSVP